MKFSDAFDDILREKQDRADRESLREGKKPLWIKLHGLPGVAYTSTPMGPIDMKGNEREPRSEVVFEHEPSGKILAIVDNVKPEKEDDLVVLAVKMLAPVNWDVPEDQIDKEAAYKYVHAFLTKTKGNAAFRFASSLAHGLSGALSAERAARDNETLTVRRRADESKMMFAEMSDPLFQAVEKGKYGDTVYVEDPKVSAYKHMAWLKRSGLTYSTVSRLDGSYTVSDDGGGQMTFAPSVTEGNGFTKALAVEPHQRLSEAAVQPASLADMFAGEVISFLLKYARIYGMDRIYAAHTDGLHFDCASGGYSITFRKVRPNLYSIDGVMCTLEGPSELDDAIYALEDETFRTPKDAANAICDAISSAMDKHRENHPEDYYDEFPESADGQLVARYETRGGRYWIEVYRSGGSYHARTDSGGASGYTRDGMLAWLCNAVYGAAGGGRGSQNYKLVSGIALSGSVYMADTRVGVVYYALDDKRIEATRQQDPEKFAQHVKLITTTVRGPVPESALKEQDLCARMNAKIQAAGLPGAVEFAVGLFTWFGLGEDGEPIIMGSVLSDAERRVDACIAAANAAEDTAEDLQQADFVDEVGMDTEPTADATALDSGFGYESAPEDGLEDYADYGQFEPLDGQGDTFDGLSGQGAVQFDEPAYEAPASFQGMIDGFDPVGLSDPVDVDITNDTIPYDLDVSLLPDDQDDEDYFSAYESVLKESGRLPRYPRELADRIKQFQSKLPRAKKSVFASEINVGDWIWDKGLFWHVTGKTKKELVTKCIYSEYPKNFLLLDGGVFATRYDVVTDPSIIPVAYELTADADKWQKSQGGTVESKQLKERVDVMDAMENDPDVIPFANDKFKVSITYSTITWPEDSDGSGNDYEEENGYEMRDEVMDFDDVCREIENGGFTELSDSSVIRSPDDVPAHIWLSTPDADTDVRTGASTTRSLHVSDIRGKDLDKARWFAILKCCNIVRR
jgi:hypothetical protein